LGVHGSAFIKWFRLCTHLKLHGVLFGLHILLIFMD
jgi:hypothetical protein